MEEQKNRTQEDISGRMKTEIASTVTSGQRFVGVTCILIGLVFLLSSGHKGMMQDLSREFPYAQKVFLIGGIACILNGSSLIRRGKHIFDF
jgi:hypothetical protein